MKYKGDTDIDLWHSVKNGSRDAFDELYRRNIQPLFKYGLSLGTNKEIVKDHIQDLFTALWRKRTQLNIDKSFKNYLFLSLRRSLFAKKGKPQLLELKEDLHDLHTEDPTTDQDETVLIQKANNIKKALELLPKRQREAIFLKYFQHLDYKEIADIMEIQIPAVYKLISVGIKKLRTIALRNK